MPDLADASAVTAALGRDLSTAEESRLDYLLGRASAAVRAYTGLSFESATVTEVRRVRDGKVTLAHRPVTEVTTVKWINQDGTPGAVAAYTFDGIDTVHVGGPGWVINLPERDHESWATVEVTYDHGHADIPVDVEGIVVDSVVRQLLAPGDGQVGLRSITVGGYAETYSDAYTSGQVTLSGDDRRTLDRYRRRTRSVPTGG